MSTTVMPERFTPRSSDLIEQFTAAVVNSVELSLSEFFVLLAREAQRAFGAKHVRIWDNNTDAGCLVLQAHCPETRPKQTADTISLETSLTGFAVEQRRIVSFDDVSEVYGNRRLQNPSLAIELGLKRLISIPVLDPRRMGPVFFVIDLYFDELVPFDIAQQEPRLEWAAKVLSIVFDYAQYRVWNDLQRSIDESASSASGAASLFDKVFPKLQLLTDCSGAEIYLLDTNNALVTERVNGDSSYASIDPQEFQRSLFERCIEKRVPTVFSETFDLWTPPKPNAQGIRWPVMATPILSSSGQALGCLVCYETHGREAGRSFSSYDLQILQSAARAIGPTLERFRRLREESRLIRVVEGVSQALVQVESIGDILQKTVEAVVEGLDAEMGAVFLIERDNSGEAYLTLRAATDPYEHLVGTAHYRIGEGITGYIATGQMVNLKSPEELTQHKNYLGKYESAIWGDTVHSQSHTFLGAPIQLGAQILGVWKIENIHTSQNHPESYFTDEDVHILQVVSSVLAYAIEHSHFKTRMVRDLTLLAQSLIGIENAKTEQEAILAVMSALEEAGWRSAALSLYDSKKKQIVGEIGSGSMKEELVSNINVSIDSDHVLARVLREGIPDFASGIGADLAEKSREKDAQRCYILPLRLDNELIGTLQVEVDSEDVLDEDERLTLHAFCAHLAVAISRIRNIKEAVELTNRVVSSSRFVVAESLSSLVVHKLKHAIDGILDELDADLRKQDIREKKELLKPLQKWRATLDTSRVGIENALILVKARGSASAECDAHAVVQQALDMWITMIKLHKCEVVKHAKAESSLCSISDPALLEIMSVMITNSIQAFARKIEISTRNEQRITLPERNFIVFALSLDFVDDGQGIGTDNTEGIFDSTYTTKPENKGTGLGLFIARRLARDAGGDLFVPTDSQRSKGLTLRLILPAREVKRDR